jgi:DNA polymerase-3 subunit alpha
MKNYVPLHVHSHYSLLDGLSKPTQIADRCKEIGVSSCALTDHGNIAGSVQFHSVLKKNNIKPILGCELYISDQDASIKNKENYTHHFLILSKNLNGWKNLVRLISESNREDFFYKKPRLHIEKLAEFLQGDMIGFCGHLGSYIANHILDKDSILPDWKNIGIKKIFELKEYFGKDNFFLEAQLMDKEYNPIQVKLTECIRELGIATNTKVICTPDAHYANKSDAIDQRILLCNNLKTTFPDINKKIINNDPIPMGVFFLSDNYYILSPEEIRDLHTEEEIENTILIDSMCEDYDISHKPMLPPFKCDNNNPDEYLRQLCRDGWRKKIKDFVDDSQTDIYADRIKYELSVLQGAGLSSYFLIVSDIVDYVRQQGWLPGPGRGSAAGCLVSYLIGITSIDPIKYNLIFERFYNAGRNTMDRISMPDIDVDVPINKREFVIDYIKNRYGHNNVSQMITFNTLKGRGALKDVLRVYGDISFEEMNEITKNIPDEAKIADELQEMKEEYGEASIIQWALENNIDKLKNWCYINDDGVLSGPLAKRFEQAIRLEGTKVNQSRHAAGIVISDHNLGDICPMVYDTKNKQKIAGMEMQDLETIGIIKFDILGVAMLDKVMAVSETLKNGEIYNE